MEQYNDSEKPIIVKAKWGKIDISYLGKTDKYKDVILWPNGHKNWDWSLYNTHHNPGIQIMNIKELVDFGCDLIILSTGFENVLQVSKQTIAWLEKNNIKYEIANSMDAIKLYNKNITNNVGLLLHSTC
ncbi:hypothetical protein QJ857_gp0172 [Tupanvirus soda lake]|uniref:Mth938 domain-containing protein n=2 Tax=Tupanvirus TaxID=2094720 RepID=A0A6N1P213_9VIRU|nr:hypothetical protein QJ857_gp0172 [Tupanvirus soda lake]QKU35852.1 hypothetical protein [Tupanvirus soda lake]